MGSACDTDIVCRTATSSPPMDFRSKNHHLPKCRATNNAPTSENIPADVAVGGGGGGGGSNVGSVAGRMSAIAKMSRRRPPSGAENAVRRWNSFHAERGECHPNKFRRDRKSTSPSIDVGTQQRRFLISSGPLAESSTTVVAGGKDVAVAGASKNNAGGGGCVPATTKGKLLRGSSLAAPESVSTGGLRAVQQQQRRYSHQPRAASLG